MSLPIGCRCCLVLLSVSITSRVSCSVHCSCLCCEMSQWKQLFEPVLEVDSWCSPHLQGYASAAGSVRFVSWGAVLSMILADHHGLQSTLRYALQSMLICQYRGQDCTSTNKSDWSDCVSIPLDVWATSTICLQNQLKTVAVYKMAPIWHCLLLCKLTWFTCDVLWHWTMQWQTLNCYLCLVPSSDRLYSAFLLVTYTVQWCR